MKSSYYNLFIEQNNNNYIIYNTLTGSIIEIDEKAKNEILNDNSESFNNEELKKLTDNGIFIKNEIDEKSIYSYKRDYHRFMEKRMHIMLTITDDCNCNCEYCFEYKKDKKKFLKNPVKDRIRKYITKTVKNNNLKFLQIDFFGGEPFIYWKVVFEEMDFYNHWCDLNNIEVTYRFYTNGTILNDNLLKKLIKNVSRIKDLQITLDGSKELHDKMRPLKNGMGSYELIMKNILQLYKFSIPIVLRVNFNIESYKKIPELLDDLLERKLNKIPLTFYAVQKLTNACESYDLAVSDKDTIKIFPFIWKECIKRNFNIYLKPKQNFLYCSASCMFSSIVNYDSEVYKCALLQTDNKYKIGEIDENGDMSNMNFEYYKWMNKNPLLNKKCNKCILLPICSGGCSGSAEHKFGTYYINNCFDMNVALIKERLKLYYKLNY